MGSEGQNIQNSRKISMIISKVVLARKKAKKIWA